MSLLDKIPSWVAFLGLILVGAAMVIIGIFLSKTAQLGFIVFGSAVIIIGIVSWIGGATGKLKGRGKPVSFIMRCRNSDANLCQPKNLSVPVRSL